MDRPSRITRYASWGCSLLLLLLGLWGCSGRLEPISVPARPDPLAEFACAPAETPYEIEVTGSKDRWQIRYPGMQHPLVSSGSALSSMELHVPQSRPVTLILNSTDYVYTLELPDWQLKEVAVPKLEFRMDFQANTPGRFELVGDHLCGAEVEELKGTLVVQSSSELLEWLRAIRARSGS